MRWGVGRGGWVVRRRAWAVGWRARSVVLLRFGAGELGLRVHVKQKVLVFKALALEIYR